MPVAGSPRMNVPSIILLGFCFLRLVSIYNLKEREQPNILFKKMFSAGNSAQSSLNQTRRSLPPEVPDPVMVALYTWLVHFRILDLITTALF